MLPLILTLILNLRMSCSLRLECPPFSLTESVKGQAYYRKKLDSFFKAQNIITFSVDPFQQSQLPPSHSLPSPPHHTLIILSLQMGLPLKPDPPLSVLFIEWCHHQSTGARILGVGSNPSPTPASFISRISL